ncbi:MAG: hypothetical protein ABR583_00720 [Gaiellaceae bacterium]
MRYLAAAAALLTFAGCGAATEPHEQGGDRTLARYGIEMALPGDWTGSINRGALVAATFDLRIEDAQWWERARKGMGGGDMLLTLHEHEPADETGVEEAFPRLQGKLELRRERFVRPEGWPPGYREARRNIALSGRYFTVFVLARTPPPADALADLNEALATLRVQPGDFYAGSVQPPLFPERAGWHVGSTPGAPVRADGDFLAAWAATVPYRDEPLSVPRQTMEQLPPGGIVMTVWLSRHNRWPPTLPNPEAPALQSPFRLSQLTPRERAGHLPRDLPIHHLFARAPGAYYIEVWLAFGREMPTPEQRREADAMLQALRLPDWGPWERD